jgi:hypothetical protein
MRPHYIFKKSTRKHKKYDVYKIINGEWRYLVSFGDNRYQQYKDKTPLKLYSSKDHNDKERRKRYYQRHGKNPVFESAKYFSHKYLW